MHILGAIQVFQLRMKKMGKDPGRVPTPFERMFTEALVYNTAIVSLHVDLDSNLLTNFFDTADFIFQSQPFSNASKLANSPVLGNGPGLFRVVSRISQLCRRTPLTPEDRNSTEALADDLHAASAALDEALDLQTEEATRRRLLGTKLFVPATNILLYKLQHPEVEAADDWIQNRVREAIDLIRLLPSPYSPAQYICWPTYIVGCALVRYSDIVFVRQTLQSMWEVSWCGDIMRAARALESNWAARGSERSGLDMLLHKRTELFR